MSMSLSIKAPFLPEFKDPLRVHSLVLVQKLSNLFLMLCFNIKRCFSKLLRHNQVVKGKQCLTLNIY